MKLWEILCFILGFHVKKLLREEACQVRINEGIISLSYCSTSCNFFSHSAALFSLCSWTHGLISSDFAGFKFFFSFLAVFRPWQRNERACRKCHRRQQTVVLERDPPPDTITSTQPHTVAYHTERTPKGPKNFIASASPPAMDVRLLRLLIQPIRLPWAGECYVFFHSLNTHLVSNSATCGCFNICSVGPCPQIHGYFAIFYSLFFSLLITGKFVFCVMSARMKPQTRQTSGCLAHTNISLLLALPGLITSLLLRFSSVLGSF